MIGALYCHFSSVSSQLDPCCALEVLFALDSSGSLIQSGDDSSNPLAWQQEKEFVCEVITNGVTSCSPVGAIEFSTSVKVISELSLDHSQVKNDILDEAFDGGSTSTRDAVQLAIDIFTDPTRNDPNIDNLLVLITDGAPCCLSSDNPCNPSLKPALQAADIKVVIIAVGTFDETDVKCLVDDQGNPSADIIEVDDFASIPDILEQLFDFTKCCGNFECEDYYCSNCQEVFGDTCLSCVDGSGCTECDYGYELTYNEECDEFFCDIESCGPAPTMCDKNIDYYGCPVACNYYGRPCNCYEECQFCAYGECKENGCNQCKEGYFKKSYNYPCIDCQKMFGDKCMFCQDFNGCGQCKQGSLRVFDSICGLYKCKRLE